MLRPAATAYTHVLISPDSHTLALIEPDTSLHCCELDLYDLTVDPPQLLITRDSAGVTVRDIPLTKDESNHIPDTALVDVGGGGYAIVYTPPR
jgi:hypothetical protein